MTLESDRMAEEGNNFNILQGDTIYSDTQVGGEVDGVELIAQLPLTMLHPALEGFGINANYTVLDSSLTFQARLTSTSIASVISL